MELNWTTTGSELKWPWLVVLLVVLLVALLAVWVRIWWRRQPPGASYVAHVARLHHDPQRQGAEQASFRERLQARRVSSAIVAAVTRADGSRVVADVGEQGQRQKASRASRTLHRRLVGGWGSLGAVLSGRELRGQEQRKRDARCHEVPRHHQPPAPTAREK